MWVARVTRDAQVSPTPRLLHLLLSALLLLNCTSDACFDLKRGTMDGKSVKHHETMEPGQRKLVARIFPRGMGVTLAGVKVEVCGARADTVHLKVQYPNIIVKRKHGTGRRATLEVDTYVVPYSVGFPILSDGNASPT